MMMISVCVGQKTEIHVLFECKSYDMVRRRWMMDIGCAGREGKNNGRNKRICEGER